MDWLTSLKSWFPLEGHKIVIFLFCSVRVTSIACLSWQVFPPSNRGSNDKGCGLLYRLWSKLRQCDCAFTKIYKWNWFDFQWTHHVEHNGSRINQHTYILWRLRVHGVDKKHYVTLQYVIVAKIKVSTKIWSAWPQHMEFGQRHIHIHTQTHTHTHCQKSWDPYTPAIHK